MLRIRLIGLAVVGAVGPFAAGAVTTPAAGDAAASAAQTRPAGAGTVDHRRRRADALPYMGTEPAPSIFGINTGTFDTSHANFVRDIPTARRLGARWVHFTGASIHFTKRGRPDYGPLDYQVRRAKRLGLGVLLSLGGTPRACSIRPRPANPTTCPPTTKRALHAYRAFLRGILLRYRKVVDYYESWLEPNHRSFWPSGPNPGQYARLLTAEHSVFENVNRARHLHLKLLFAGPSDFSIIPGSPGGVPALPFVHQALADLGGLRVFDGIALHPYRFPQATTGPAVMDWDSVVGIPAASDSAGPYPADRCDSPSWCQMTWAEELSAYEQEFADAGYGEMPLWLTEFGWPGDARSDETYHPSYAAQADDLSQAYAAILSLPFVQAAFWFNLRDYRPGERNPDPEFFGHYGLLRYRFAPKPAASVFSQLARANMGR